MSVTYHNRLGYSHMKINIILYCQTKLGTEPTIIQKNNVRIVIRQKYKSPMYYVMETKTHQHNYTDEFIEFYNKPSNFEEVTFVRWIKSPILIDHVIFLYQSSQVISDLLIPKFKNIDSDYNNPIDLIPLPPNLKNIVLLFFIGSME
jgi:hypothetical protein